MLLTDDLACFKAGQSSATHCKKSVERAIMRT